jgi:hypothetical protein
MTPPAPAASSPDFIKPDRIYPDMGAVFDGHGTHFAVFSENAQAIELCLFGPGGRDEQRLELPHREGPVFSGYLPGIRPGQQYGYRAHGPYDPAQGHRFNPNKLLLDPYARATAGASHGTMRSGAMTLPRAIPAASTPAIPPLHGQGHRRGSAVRLGGRQGHAPPLERNHHL